MEKLCDERCFYVFFFVEVYVCFVIRWMIVYEENMSYDEIVGDVDLIFCICLGDMEVFGEFW